MVYIIYYFDISNISQHCSNKFLDYPTEPAPKIPKTTRIQLPNFGSSSYQGISSQTQHLGYHFRGTHIPFPLRIKEFWIGYVVYHQTFQVPKTEESSPIKAVKGKPTPKKMPRNKVTSIPPVLVPEIPGEQKKSKKIRKFPVFSTSKT